MSRKSIEGVIESLEEAIEKEIASESLLKISGLKPRAWILERDDTDSVEHLAVGVVMTGADDCDVVAHIPFADWIIQQAQGFFCEDTMIGLADAMEATSAYLREKVANHAPYHDAAEIFDAEREAGNNPDSKALQSIDQQARKADSASLSRMNKRLGRKA